MMGEFHRDAAVSRFMVSFIAAAFVWLTLVMVTIAAPFTLVLEFIALLLALAMVTVLLLYPSPVPRLLRGFVGCMAVGGVALVQWRLPVLAGPDEYTFYQHVMATDTGYLLSSIWQDLKNFSRPSARYTVPVFFAGMLGELVRLGPGIIVLGNLFLWWLAALMWVQCVCEGGLFPARQRRRAAIVIFILLMLSSSVLYWSSVFAKDVATTALTIMAAAMAFRARYLPALVLLLLASLSRPYSVVFFFAFIKIN